MKIARQRYGMITQSTRFVVVVIDVRPSTPATRAVASRAMSVRTARGRPPRSAGRLRPAWRLPPDLVRPGAATWRTRRPRHPRTEIVRRSGPAEALRGRPGVPAAAAVRRPGRRSRQTPARRTDDQAARRQTV